MGFRRYHPVVYEGEDFLARWDAKDWKDFLNFTVCLWAPDQKLFDKPEILCLGACVEAASLLLYIETAGRWR